MYFCAFALISWFLLISSSFFLLFILEVLFLVILFRFLGLFLIGGFVSFFLWVSQGLCFLFNHLNLAF